MTAEWKVGTWGGVEARREARARETSCFSRRGLSPLGRLGSRTSDSARPQHPRWPYAACCPCFGVWRPRAAAFAMLDTDGSGAISTSEVKSGLQLCGMVRL